MSTTKKTTSKTNMTRGKGMKNQPLCGWRFDGRCRDAIVTAGPVVGPYGVAVNQNRPVTRVCPFGHDHPPEDWSYHDCELAYEDAKARRDEIVRNVQASESAVTTLLAEPTLPDPSEGIKTGHPRRPMLVAGHRYQVVYREQGKRLPREIVADFVSNTRSFAYFSGRPDFGTVQLAFADIIEFSEVPYDTKIQAPRAFRG